MTIRRRKVGRPLKPASLNIGILWFDLWLTMAALDRYQRIVEQNRQADPTLVSTLTRFSKSVSSLGEYEDPNLPALMTIKQFSPDLTKLYQTAKDSQWDESKKREWSKYREDIGTFLDRAGIDSNPKTITDFALSWDKFDGFYESQAIAARTILAKHFGLPSSDKTISQYLKKRLVHLPNEKDIPCLDLLKPLLRSIYHSDKQIQRAIVALEVDLN